MVSTKTLLLKHYYRRQGEIIFNAFFALKDEKVRNSKNARKEDQGTGSRGNHDGFGGFGGFAHDSYPPPFQEAAQYQPKVCSKKMPPSFRSFEWGRLLEHSFLEHFLQEF